MSKEWDVKQHGTGPFSFDETPKAVPADTPMEIKDFPMSRNEFEKRLAADTPTPRTDLLDSKLPWNADPALAHASLSAHARQIERELAAANAEIEKLKGPYDGKPIAELMADLIKVIRERNEAQRSESTLQKQLVAALVDAERLKFLQTKAYVAVNMHKSCLWTLRDIYEQPEGDFIEAIDAARRTE